MTFGEYCSLEKEEKLEMALGSDTPLEVLNFLFYDEDEDVRFNVAQNERLPVNKLKKLARNDSSVYVKNKALEMYEERYVY
jgi:hypothetical protein